VCAIKLPVFGINNDKWLEDLAMLVGTKVVDEEAGISLSEITASSLGFAKQVTVGISNTKIVESKRDKGAIEKRLEVYEKDLEKLIGDRDRFDVQRRMSFLSSKAAVITVGYSTELELHEKGDRVDDAMCAVRAAREEGFVPGGGTTLLRLSRNIDIEELDERYRFGAEALLKSCERPIRQILENAGENIDEIISKIMKKDDFEFGYNIDSEEYGSLTEMGVIDPKKVTRAALQNAATISLLLITTEAAIADIPENQSGYQPPAGWRLPDDKLNHKY